MPKLDPDGKITISACPDFEGQKCIIQHLKMPMMLSNRSIPSLIYLRENADGTVEFLSSSRETDALVQLHRDKIKKDTVGHNVISYLKLTPIEGGCEWISVQCMSMGGSIPEMLRRQGDERQAKAAMT